MAEKTAETRSWAGRLKQAWNRGYCRQAERWENRLAARTTDRVVRKFEWGLEWTEGWPCKAQIDPVPGEPAAYLRALSEAALSRDSRFFSYATPEDFRLEEGMLRFTSPVASPHPENNTVYGQWFPARSARRRAVLVLPHWNAQIEQHVSLCRGLSRLGISALRVSLPYHDLRMPRELHRADYAVSSNVARTVDAARQAVLDARSCLDWLETLGYRSLGIVGTSLGSCYAFLASAHDARLRSNVFNLFSLHFADVVWTGLSTRHIRDSLVGHVELPQLREAWRVISPSSHVDRYAQHRKESLFIYGSCDTTFLPEYSRAMLAEMRNRQVPHKVVVMPCGHYTLGETPFRFLDGYHICSFLLKTL